MIKLSAAAFDAEYGFFGLSLSFSINSMAQPQEGDATLIRVEQEDQSVVESVQKGIKSRYYKRGRYSPIHEKGVHHFHGLLVDALNSSVCS